MRLKLLILLLCATAPLINFAQSFSEVYLDTKDGVSLFTKKVGFGEPILFIHGGPGAWSKSFENLGGKNLENHFSFIYYDQRGCGRSSSSSNNDYSLNTMLNDIELIRKHYGLDQFYIMGHSFGGLLATIYTSKYPSHVKGLILLNATLNVEQSIKNQIKFMKKELNITSKDSVDYLKEFTQLQVNMAEKNIDYKLLTNSLENFTILNDIDSEIPSDFAFARQALFIDDYLKNHIPLSSKISTKSLIIAGKSDYAIGVNHHKQFLFPNKKIVELNSGHLGYFEENETILNALLKFINN